MTPTQWEKIFNSDLTVGEKDVLRYQFGKLNDFRMKLFQAISHAHRDDLDRLAKGFPDEVQGFKAWAHGDLYNRVAAVLDQARWD